MARFKGCYSALGKEKVLYRLPGTILLSEELQLPHGIFNVIGNIIHTINKIIWWMLKKRTLQNCKRKDYKRFSKANLPKKKSIEVFLLIFTFTTL